VCAGPQSAKFRRHKSDSTRGAPDAGAADCTCIQRRSVMRLVLIRFAIAIALLASAPIIAIAAQ